MRNDELNRAAASTPTFGVITLFLTLEERTNDLREFILWTLVLVSSLGIPSVFGQKVVSEGELKIMEAVYRYQIAHCTESDTSNRVFFVGIYDGKTEKNPSDQLLDKLKDIEPKIKKYSDMDRSGNNNQFVDKQTGQPAVLLSIEKLKWIGDAEAEVLGSCGFAEWAAHGYRYRVVLDNTRWRVDAVNPTWVF